MTDPTYNDFAQVSSCDLADALPRHQFMHYAIHPLWSNMPRIAGRAFTVHCGQGDNLMLHAAIYAAQAGDILVVQANDQYAVSGGNVCAIAQARGITGFVIDGVIRDIDEVVDIKFPVHALGTCPKPGAKKVYIPLNNPVVCGGVNVHTGDIIVADNDGIAVIPKAQAKEALATAVSRRDTDAQQTLAQWQSKHEQNVKDILHKLTP
ncbi:RraA family protein [Brumicola pallidula]|jgi:regulator of RNase E activity RraA|uniref:Dimethylmenaquinone methyltransferase n=1 Tax=Brumicola pallidula DSM 14239 = ACAM 615 TaxID=1121922 RepID=K6ZUV5_9ALTE|nr:RraA family protein [Glaciecola pallidula]GAC27115.1 dimethylmenaquinone methyltransferase [Glaciecola pallidula DSM 14239 = ACAM 615]